MTGSSGAARSLRWAAILALISTCAPDVEPWLRRPARRAALFRGLPSYASAASVRERLGIRIWTQKKEKRGRSRGCCSRSFDFRVLEAKVGHVRHLAQDGSLELTFLNDRLVRTVFLPQDGRSYLRALIAGTPLHRVGDRPIGAGPLPHRFRLLGAPPHTRVLVRTDGKGVRVLWLDTRLIKAYWEVQSRGSSRYMEGS